MLHDLAGKGHVAEDAHFLVIGAGTVGLPTAVLLAQKTGRKIVCLESGGARQDGETHPLNAVVHLGSVYKGAEEGRFRCLGGASTRWGGALIPFQDADLRGCGWPLGMDALTPYLPEAEALFGLDPGPYCDPDFRFDLGAHHVNRLAKWPPFKKRNVAALLDSELRSDPGVAVWLNAHATAIAVSAEGVTVKAQSMTGDTLEIRARKLIVAAGAIETTRLALLIDRQNGGAVSRTAPAVGRYFGDHLSVEVGEIDVLRRSELNRVIGFRFGRGGTMRNIRFELAPETALRNVLPPSFAHIAFETDQPSGFDALRDIYRCLQRRRAPPPALFGRLLRHAPWLARAVWWRFARSRLLFPAGARLIVHVVVEQAPAAENRIGLSETQRDAFGSPLAEIRWAVREADKRNLCATAAAFERSWNEGGLSALGRLRLFDRRSIEEALDKSGGIYHPTGSTRMGDDPADGVVDRDLNLYGLPHVQLLATSVLPTGGGANPTMTLLLLALRCVEQHRRALAA